jgi:hypothetical protein
MAEIAGFWCSLCGQWHEGLPMDLAFVGPHPDILSSAREREEEIEQSEEWCIINQWETCMVRTILTLPVTDSAEDFRFGVWVSVSAKHLLRILESWHTGMPDDEPTYSGYLCNRLPGYPDTLFLEVDTDARSATQRPSVSVRQTDHLLAIEQQQGITMARVQQIIEANEHSE